MAASHCLPDLSPRTEMGESFHSLPLKAFVVLTLAEHMKSARSSCEKNEKESLKEKLNEASPSPTPLR